jgi:hypothetical protein
MKTDFIKLMEERKAFVKNQINQIDKTLSLEEKLSKMHFIIKENSNYGHEVYHADKITNPNMTESEKTGYLSKLIQIPLEYGIYEFLNLLNMEEIKNFNKMGGMKIKILTNLLSTPLYKEDHPRREITFKLLNLCKEKGIEYSFENVIMEIPKGITILPQFNSNLNLKVFHIEDVQREKFLELQGAIYEVGKICFETRNVNQSIAPVTVYQNENFFESADNNATTNLQSYVSMEKTLTDVTLQAHFTPKLLTSSPYEKASDVSINIQKIENPSTVSSLLTQEDSSLRSKDKSMQKLQDKNPSIERS